FEEWVFSQVRKCFGRNRTKLPVLGAIPPRSVPCGVTQAEIRVSRHVQFRITQLPVFDKGLDSQPVIRRQSQVSLEVRLPMLRGLLDCGVWEVKRFATTHKKPNPFVRIN